MKGKISRRRKKEYGQPHLFSILVPLYNTPVSFLKEMIESVLSQTYGRWELCLADGSDESHSEVEQCCARYAAKDARVRYRRLPENYGIADNTNICLSMAKGDYLVLFDHDDRLHPRALYEVQRAIEQTGADFLYTDEITFERSIKKAYCPHRKPDFSPDTLRSYNYICHLSVFSKKLLDRVGGLRREFNGSQDYDLILRLTEQAECVCHIPQILYYWRSHAQSVASDVGAKSYAVDAAKRALGEHLQRCGLSGEVSDAKLPSAYHIRYALDRKPLVSVIVTGAKSEGEFSECSRQVSAHSVYENLEILPAGFDGYDAASVSDAVRRAKGDYFVFLEVTVAVMTPQWLEELLMFAQREDVGAVGGALYAPDGRVLYAGYALDARTGIRPLHQGAVRGDYGYMSRLTIAQNVSAVSGACLMVSRANYDRVGGLSGDCGRELAAADLCLKLGRAGLLQVFTPFAELTCSPQRRPFRREVRRFRSRWPDECRCSDPYASLWR